MIIWWLTESTGRDVVSLISGARATSEGGCRVKISKDLWELDSKTAAIIRCSPAAYRFISFCVLKSEFLILVQVIVVHTSRLHVLGLFVFVPDLATVHNSRYIIERRSLYFSLWSKKSSAIWMTVGSSSGSLDRPNKASALPNGRSRWNTFQRLKSHFSCKLTSQQILSTHNNGMPCWLVMHDILKWGIDKQTPPTFVPFLSSESFARYVRYKC